MRRTFTYVQGMYQQHYVYMILSVLVLIVLIMGLCNGNECHCDTPWHGKKCDLIDCNITNCNGHGHCTNGKIKKVMLSPLYFLCRCLCV